MMYVFAVGLRALALQAVVGAALLLLVPLAAARDRRLGVTKTVVVRIGDQTITFSTRKVPAGTVKFVVKDTGTKPHAFRVGGKSTPVLSHGRSAILFVRFAKGGKYLYRVTLFRGRSGTIAVAAPSSGKTGATKSQVAAGKAVFKSAGCGNCHTLKAAGASGTVGPDLDRLKLTLAKIVDQVTNGGRFMPPFAASAGGSLSTAQIQNVAAFIYASEHS
jgi:mono/diheme cytochrome c family protein